MTELFFVIRFMDEPVDGRADGFSHTWNVREDEVDSDKVEFEGIVKPYPVPFKTKLPPAALEYVGDPTRVAVYPPVFEVQEVPDPE